jgi:CHAT domain-containing protein
MVAWISTEDTHGQTLAMIADRLNATLLEHGVEMDTRSAVSQGLAGSKLVIVGAHGSIAPEGRFFQRVNDEGILKLTAAELAGALRNVGVVILFVCSGGRADKHPAANTTIGLAKQLLDRGCTAVIASPWPLDARVTYHWLPVFLDRWKGGSLLMDANFQANLAVSNALSANPAKCLAMTVFGDPLRTFDS